MKFAFLILFSNLIFAQQQSQIFSSLNKTPISYVNIWCNNSNFGTSSDVNGIFSKENFNVNDTLLFTAVGFESKRIILKNISNELFLNPITEELKEVVLLSKKKIKLKTKKIKKADYIVAFAEKDPATVFARFLPFKEEFREAPFINKIKISTFTGERNTFLNIHIYDVGENGEPKNHLVLNNIIFYPEKGSNISEIDVSSLNIEFPETGIFIGVEVPKIEQNKITVEKEYRTDKKDVKGYSVFQPLIKMTDAEDIKDTWSYRNGEWKINKKFSLPIQIELTN
jgi:hypothetical protein